MKYHLCDLLSTEFQPVFQGEYALALGNFDGMHLGHQNVIATAVNDAKNIGCKSAIVTFHPHPSQVLSRHPSKNGNKNFNEILSLDQKIALIKDIGVDEVFIIQFNYKLSILSPEQFIELLCAKLQIRSIVTGCNFRFGHNRSGDVNTIKYLGIKYGFNFHVIHKILIDSQNISSSWLRIALRAGCVGLFAKLSGRNYIIEGFIDVKKEFVVGDNSYKAYIGHLSDSIRLLPTGAYLCSIASTDYLILLLDPQTISQLLSVEYNSNNTFMLLKIEKNHLQEYQESKITITLSSFLKPYTKLNNNIQEWINSCMRASKYLTYN